MNRYPLWKYALIALSIVLALLYVTPNFYGETPAVQVSTNRQSISIDGKTQKTVENALTAAKIPFNGSFVADGSVKVRFADEETQIKAKNVIEQTMGDGYIVALNLIANSPDWMAKIGANPMFQGLDLRGGVHFLMQVDMDAAMQKKLDGYSADSRRALRKAKIRNGGVKRIEGAHALSIAFNDAEVAKSAEKVLAKTIPEAKIEAMPGDPKLLRVAVTPETEMRIRQDAIKQNINTLHNRVNAIGVAEPIIQQSGSDRIVVELPGIQDTAKAKDIIGRTASLELHMVGSDSALQEALTGVIPEGYEILYEAGERQVPVLINKEVELTGDELNSAQPGFDQNGAPAVNLELSSRGAAIFGDLTKENVGKRMAMVLIDQGKKQVVTAPVIRTAILGGRVEISGAMSVAEANDTALLLRSGALAAPMTIVEERTIGPSAGKDNLQKGFDSVVWGFIVVILFMAVYYEVFGVISVLSLCLNLVFLIAILSFLQATLTLPGIAAIALTLGMAIDSNVLINERIREEIRDGQPPQTAIHAGYQHAWDTILDSNTTSFIAGAALLIFGSGPVRSFAIVHCLGILTSVYSSVVCSRAMSNLWYGTRKSLKKIHVGTIYIPENHVTASGRIVSPASVAAEIQANAAESSAPSEPSDGGAGQGSAKRDDGRKGKAKGKDKNKGSDGNGGIQL